MAASPMCSVGAASSTRQNTPHDVGNWSQAGAQLKTKIIGHQGLRKSYSYKPLLTYQELLATKIPEKTNMKPFLLAYLLSPISLA
jgi:hypothetical protein